MDLRKRTDGPIDPDAQLEIDDEYFEGHKKVRGGRTAKIRPETGERNYEESGYGDSMIYSSTKKLTTQGDFLDTEEGFSPEDSRKFAYGRDHLEQTLDRGKPNLAINNKNKRGETSVEFTSEDHSQSYQE